MQYSVHVPITHAHLPTAHVCLGSMAFRRKGNQDSLGSDPNSSSASTSSASEGTLPRNKCKLVSSQTRDREYSAQTTWSFGKGSATPAMR